MGLALGYQYKNTTWTSKDIKKDLILKQTMCAVTQ